MRVDSTLHGRLLAMRPLARRSGCRVLALMVVEPVPLAAAVAGSYWEYESAVFSLALATIGGLSIVASYVLGYVLGAAVRDHRGRRDGR